MFYFVLDCINGFRSCLSTVEPKVLKDLDEPKMTCKAYCGRVITEWLSRELATANLNHAGQNEEIRWAAVTVTLAKKKCPG